MTLHDFITQWHDASEHITVHTSGSTGKPKSMLVEKRRMLASARITCDFLGLKPGNTALLCMPLDYIAGKMVVVRSIERGLELIDVVPSNHPLAEIDRHIDFAAMVPSQVYGSLQVPVERERLMDIKHLIIGGGAIPAQVENELRNFPNAVWSTYGMTETLSHIALRRISGPEASMWYTPFDTVKLSLADADSDTVGQLVIEARQVCEEELITNDIVEINHIDGTTQFRVIGRIDNVVCSGGVKLHIEEIEQQLQNHIGFPYCVTKRADVKFGEVAVLLIERGHSTPEQAMQLCRNVLQPFSVPKAVLTVDTIPLTGTGKTDRATAMDLAKTV